MSPVSRRRPSRGRGRTRPEGVDPARLRDRPPLDVLIRELERIGEPSDAFRGEGSIGYVLGLLDVRGPGAGASYAAFCREALDDPRAATTALGVRAAACLAEFGHPSVRPAAAEIVVSAEPWLREELPAWTAQLGRVHVMEAGSLRTPDESETVLHVLLDYDEPAAGSRHLLSIAVEHRTDRVHLLDVRARGPHDSIAPIAAAYDGSTTARWHWHEVAEIDALVAAAVRATWSLAPDDWSVQDVEGQPTPAWALGSRRLEQLTGADLRGSAG